MWDITADVFVFHPRKILWIRHSFIKHVVVTSMSFFYLLFSVSNGPRAFGRHPGIMHGNGRPTTQMGTTVFWKQDRLTLLCPSPPHPDFVSQIHSFALFGGSLTGKYHLRHRNYTQDLEKSEHLAIARQGHSKIMLQQTKKHQHGEMFLQHLCAMIAAAMRQRIHNIHF